MDQIHYDWKSVGTYYDGYIVDVDSEFTEEYEQKGTELFSWIFHLARQICCTDSPEGGGRVVERDILPCTSLKSRGRMSLYCISCSQMAFVAIDAISEQAIL